MTEKKNKKLRKTKRKRKARKQINKKPSRTNSKVSEYKSNKNQLYFYPVARNTWE